MTSANDPAATTTAPIIIDRSRVSAAEKCPRYRYWHYEHQGLGIEQAGEWLDPLIGTAVHNAIESLVQGQPTHIGVAIAQETILEAHRRGPIQVYKQSPDPEVDIAEGCDLAEALVRGWAATRLAELLATYDVVAVEQEMAVEYRCQGRTIRQLSRPDLILRRKSDRALFIMNLKTVSRADDKWRSKWQYDMQTFSEAAAVEATLGEPVAGTIIAGLVKGSRSDYKRDLGPEVGPGKFHWSDCPLLWAWRSEAEGFGVDQAWYARYEWRCTGPHTLGNGKRCQGGADHRLSKVRKAPVTERPGGIPLWIDNLAKVDPDLLAEQFIELPPILRSPYEIERWKRQALPREVDIREHREYLLRADSNGDDEIAERLFDSWFPMSTADGNCVWPTRCTFFQVCHGTARDDLAGNGFQPRDPNHPGELEEQ